MALFTRLEDSLNDVFGKSAPRLPESGKKFLVEYLPILTLFGSLLAIWAAWAVWQMAHRSASVVDSMREIYSNTTIQTNSMTPAIWLAIIVLLIEAVLYVLAHPGLRDHQKSGWNMLFYVALLNVVYGVIRLFTNYGGVSSLVGAIVGSAIGLYFLFQVRGSYMADTSVKPTDTSTTH